VRQEALEEEISIDATGHTEDIVMVLNDFERVVREGPGALDRLATGEDGYQAQYAMETANAFAAGTRIPVPGAP